MRRRQKAAPKAASGAPIDQTATEVYEEGSWWQRMVCYAFEEEDASYLAVFRVMWGLIMALECYQHIVHDFAKTRTSFYQNPYFQFKFWGLEWVKPPADELYMKIFVCVMLVLALCVTVSFFYRLTCVLFSFGFLYLYALEAAWYLNHFYLVIVMSFMLCFLPCNVYFSLDALLFPKIARKTVPK